MATNIIFDPGYQLSVVVTNPTTPSSNDPVRFGNLTGIALTDEGADGNVATKTSCNFGPFVADFLVDENEGDASGIQVGEAVFYTDTPTGSPTTSLNNSPGGYFFGIALEVVAQNATTTIQVMHVTPTVTGTFNIEDGSVTTAKIADLAVTEAKIGALAVTTAKIAALAVGTTEIAALAVTEAKIGALAVTGAKIAAATITADKLNGNLAVGFIPMPLVNWREVLTNDIGTAADGAAKGSGGILAKDTTPILEFTNGATDSAIRIHWATTDTDQIVFQVPLPPDLDRTADIELHVRAGMAGATNDPLLTALTFFNEGDTVVTDTIEVTAGVTFTDYTITIAAADVPADAQTMTTKISPESSATDALFVTGIWVQYTRTES